jgi:cyclic-di-GMP-binding protein
MLLNLNVPPLSRRVLAEVELRPARVAKQISELPMLNVVETSRRLASMIHVNNRIEIIDSVRLELLELYRKPVHDLSIELQKLYLGQPVPLTERQNAAAEQDRQFQIEMAFGYKRLVLNGTTGAAPNNLPPADAALVMQRAIRHLAEAIAISYEIYSPYPFGAWQEIHALYGHAEKLNIADVQIVDPLNKTMSATSVAHVYKQALLLDLADPYHLPARLTEKVQHYLDRWANLALLLPPSQTFDPTCQFLIDRNADHAGIANTHETPVDPPERYRLLNTVELARLVHMHLTSIGNGERPNPDGLEDTFFNDSAADLLKRLINVWGLHPKRSFRRNRSNQQKMDVAIGINAINHWLNGCARFVVSSDSVGPAPRAPEMSEKKESHPELEFVSWDVLDESAGGFSLTLEGRIRVRVRVGDVLAVRASGGTAAWSLAAVRWMRSPNASEIEIGAQRLAPAADAVVIKLMTDEGKESDFLPAMRLPEIKALNQAPSLITHCGVFRPQRQLYLDDGQRRQQIIATQAIEVTSAFERFQFQLAPV